VILNADDVLRSIHLVRGCATIAAPEVEVLSLKNKAFIQRFDNLLRPAEILIVAFAFSGEECVQSVMKIIAPHRINPVAAVALWPDDARIVLVGFSNHANRTAQLTC